MHKLADVDLAVPVDIQHVDERLHLLRSELEALLLQEVQEFRRLNLAGGFLVSTPRCRITIVVAEGSAPPARSTSPLPSVSIAWKTSVTWIRGRQQVSSLREQWERKGTAELEGAAGAGEHSVREQRLSISSG